MSGKCMGLRANVLRIQSEMLITRMLFSTDLADIPDLITVCRFYSMFGSKRWPFHIFISSSVSSASHGQA